MGERDKDRGRCIRHVDEIHVSINVCNGQSSPIGTGSSTSHVKLGIGRQRHLYSLACCMHCTSSIIYYSILISITKTHTGIKRSGDLKIRILKRAYVTDCWFQTEKARHDKTLYEEDYISQHLSSFITRLALEVEEIVVKELVATAIGKVI